MIIDNRPTKRGIYTTTTVLKSAINLEQARQIAVKVGTQFAGPNDQQAIIGLWRGIDPSTQKKVWFLQPPAPQTWQAYNLTFEAGSAAGIVQDPTSSAKDVLQLKQSLVLFNDIVTPEGYQPVQTFIADDGNPIKEQYSDGSWIDFAPQLSGEVQLQTPQLQQSLFGNGNNGSNGSNNYLPPMQASDQGGDQDWQQAFQDLGPVQGISGFGQWQVAKAGLTVAKPYLYKAALWIGKWLAIYYGAKYILQNVFKMIVQWIGQIPDWLYNQAKKAFGDSLTVPALIIAGIIGTSLLLS